MAGALALVLIVGGACTGSDEDDGSAGDDIDGGEVRGDGDEFEAVIRRGSGGVPHITGDTFEDVLFGQGWAQGEDRTCDLADQVVKLRGERAKFLGPGEGDANVTSDIAWKTIGLYDRATTEWDDEVDAEVKEMVTAFTAGWNAHLEETGVDDVSGWCAGEDWVREIEPVDVYANARQVSLFASSVQLIDYITAARPPGEAAEGTTSTTEADDATSTTEADAGAEDDEADDEATTTTEEAAAVPGLFEDKPVASNGWAIGTERSANQHGMLVANPHFPWEGELRFWESHLTVPGEMDIYGVMLSGLPGIGIGFTDEFAWTHTVSAGNRFTAYKLELVPGEPTKYRYGDEVRDMEAQDITVEVLGDDGELDEVTRTMWSSHYGPIIDVRDEIDIPDLGWTETSALTFRDANIDDDEMLEQYLRMDTAEDFDELVDAHREVGGVPLFNTIAVSDDGRAWYSDTSATPNLSAEAIEGFERSKESDPLVGLTADSGLVLLDGSDPANEWQEAAGARDPGLVPFDDQPSVERDDYVFNANDSFWLPHATEVLEGDYSFLHGAQRTPRSPRTRENATVLADVSAEGPSGEDGLFTLDELADAALLNRGYTSRVLLGDVVERCEAANGPVGVEALAGEDGEDVLPAEFVDIEAACEVLAGWDGVYDVDRAGPVVWREMLSQFAFADLMDAGNLWSEPFDADEPVDSPSGLATDVGEGSVDPAMQALARAVQVLERAEIAVDAPLGDVQFALRDGERIPLHGGDFVDGTTNVVDAFPGWSILDPALDELDREPLVEGSGSNLVRVTASDETGYMVDDGTSFLLALNFTDDGPEARAFLTYGETEDRSSDLYTEATQAFSDKEWRDIAFTADQVDDDATSAETVRG
jgi:acyl-homoserine-lactone acylase